MATDPTHHSRAYVEMITKFLEANKAQRAYWRKFCRMGIEYQVHKLAIKRSQELRDQFDLKPRQCYFNAARLVMEFPFSLEYVEGIATSILPTEHAWVVDKTYGWVIDPTWVTLHTSNRVKCDHKIKDYFGVRIPLDLVRQQLLDDQVYGPLLPRCITKIKS